MDNPNYCRTQPCNNCPYRKDAPVKHWSILEFKDLVASENNYIGKVYGCHKADGHVCVGWLMNQDKRAFPSIALRMSLSEAKITREYLDKLSCKSEMFASVKEMCIANYKHLNKLFKNRPTVGININTMAKIYIIGNIEKGIIEIDADLENVSHDGYLELSPQIRQEYKFLQYRLHKKEWSTDLNSAKIQANKNVKSTIKRLQSQIIKISAEIEKLKNTKF